jgi:hypothetical protein
MHHFLATVRLYVFDPALRASIVAATTPNVSPFLPIFGAAIIVDELPSWHLVLLS